VPVPPEDLADPERRREWARTTDMTMFSLASPDHPATEIDLFIEEPFPFAAATPEPSGQTWEICEWPLRASPIWWR
jgi:hypothetical protein